MLITKAFSKFGAQQKNIQWSVSAISESNELVVSLWDQFFEKRSKGTMTYIDKKSRWSGPGNSELIQYLDYAHKNELKVRAIIAKSKRPDIVAAGGAANNLGNTFHPKLDWVGEINLWGGDTYEITFIVDN